MLYNPHHEVESSRTSRVNNNPLENLLLYGIGNSSNVGIYGNCNPLIALQVLEETTGELSWARFRKSMGTLGGKFTALFHRHAARKATDRIDARLGLDLELSEEAYAEMMEEVRRFQWIEAERAGRNIWAESSCKDPEVAAFKEWFRRHFGAWYLSRRQTKQLSPAR